MRELANHLRRRLNLFTQNQGRDGVERVEEEVRLKLIAKRANLRLACQPLDGEQLPVLLFELQVILDAKVEGGPCDEREPAARRSGDDLAPRKRRTPGAEDDRGLKGSGRTQQAQRIRRSNAEGCDRAEPGTALPQGVTEPVHRKTCQKTAGKKRSPEGDVVR